MCELWPRYHDGLATGDTLVCHLTPTRPPDPPRSPTLCPIGNGCSEPAIQFSKAKEINYNVCYIDKGKESTGNQE